MRSSPGRSPARRPSVPLPPFFSPPPSSPTGTLPGRQIRTRACRTRPAAPFSTPAEGTRLHLNAGRPPAEIGRTAPPKSQTTDGPSRQWDERTVGPYRPLQGAGKSSKNEPESRRGRPSRRPAGRAKARRCVRAARPDAPRPPAGPWCNDTPRSSNALGSAPMPACASAPRHLDPHRSSSPAPLPSSSSRIERGGEDEKEGELPPPPSFPGSFRLQQQPQQHIHLSWAIREPDAIAAGRGVRSPPPRSFF